MSRVFCLVHGAWHGAWCWEAVVRELERRGEPVVAVDLPIEEATAGCVRYAEVVMEAIAGEADVVLVGHSLSGLVIPLVASARPVRQLVYLASLLPEPGRAMFDQEHGYNPRELRNHIVRTPDGFLEWQREAAPGVFYHDCAPEDAARATALLRRQAVAPLVERFPLERLPRVPSAYVVCADDRVVAADWSRLVARERLAIEPIELPGGHSPMLARPRELVELLLAL